MCQRAKREVAKAKQKAHELYEGLDTKKCEKDL